MKTLFCLFIFLAASIGTYAQNSCSICDKFKNNVVQLTTNFDDGREENGFGTVIAEKDNELYIVTAKHVIYNLDEKGFISIDTKTKSVTVKFFSDQGKDYTATLLKLPNTSLDISLLEVEKPKDYSWSKDFYSEAIETGTKVWFIGRAAKWYIPTGSFVGSVNDISSDDEILIDINSIQPGTSGAPLISADGMVGLIFEDAASGAKAYPVDKIIKLVTKTWNYEWQMNLNPNITHPEVSDQAEQNTTPTNSNEEDELWAGIKGGRHPDMYLEKYPNGKYIDQIEELTWQRAENATKSKALGYKYYLKWFPTGKYKDKAKEMIKKYQ